MTRVAGLMLLLIGLAGFASARPVPEIDLSTAGAGSALALLSGAILIFRSSRKK